MYILHSISEGKELFSVTFVFEKCVNNEMLTKQHKKPLYIVWRYSTGVLLQRFISTNYKQLEYLIN